MNATIAALVWCAIQVTVLTCGVAVVYLAARRVHPRAGAAAAGGGLLMVIALTVMIASPWPRWKFERVTTPRVAAAGNANESTKADAHEPPVDAAHPPIESTVENPSYWALFADAINHSTSGASVHSATTGEPAALRLPTVIAVVLLSGALLAAVRLAWGVMSVRRLARSGRSVDEVRLATLVQDLQARLDLDTRLAVREVDGLSTPATVGWRRPVVLLPTAWREWSDVELRAVIAHELAHIAGRDYVAWFVARVAVVAHFYHPLVRWLAARLQLEQELAADMTAARALGDAKQYLHSLAALALAMPANRMTGPARTLFPSRSLLVRRVEMLRTNGFTRARSRWARYGALAVVAIVGLGAAGLRGPGIELASQAIAQTPGEPQASAPGATKVDRIGLEIVPLDALYVLSIRVADLARDPNVGSLVRSLAERAPQLTGPKLAATDITEVMFIPYGSMQGLQNVRIAIRFRSPDLKQGFTSWYEKMPGVEKGAEPGIWKEGSNVSLAAIDDLTVVFDRIQRTPGKERASLENVSPPWAAAWKERKDKLVLGAFELPAELRTALEGKAPGGSSASAIALAAHPLLSDMDWVVADLEITDVLKVSAVAQCRDNEAARGVRETLQALVVMVRNSVRAYRTQVEQIHAANSQGPILQRLLAECDTALGTADFSPNGSQVNAALHTAISTGDAAKLAMSLLPTVEQARAAARNATSMNNLKQLALAMLNHEAARKVFPAAAGNKKGNATSQYPHSWRIDVLPYLEQAALYDRYHFDEPWDSEANKKVLAEMPPQFRSPFDPDPKSTNTSYFVFTGEDTMFPGKQGIPIMQITDGPARTFMLVESKRDVPWTKPEDIAYDKDQPPPKIEGWEPGQFLVALVDGSVFSVASDIDEATMRAFITRNGGENVPNLPRPKASAPRW